MKMVYMGKIIGLNPFIIYNLKVKLYLDMDVDLNSWVLGYIMIQS